MNPLLTKPYYAGAALTARRIVKLSADNTVILAAANTDALIGVNGALTLASGQAADVVMAGIAQVELGGTVTRGNFLTSDSVGRAVVLGDTVLDANTANAVGIALQSGVVGDLIDILVYPQRQSKNDALTASVNEINVLDGAPAAAAFVIGAEAANVINVGVQLQNADGSDLAVRGSVFAYISDDQYGNTLAAAHSTGGAIGTDGLAIPLVANRAWQLTSESDGDIDINFTEAGAKTAYLVLVMPNGKLVVSSAITHAA